MKFLALALLLAVTRLAFAVQVVDDRGATIDIPQPPQRIVSMLPSLTETVCELGACERLVGVDDYSNWPARVTKLPHLGGLEDANIEAIVSLKPDIVLLSASSRALGRLQSLGLKVVALEARTLADVHRVALKVAQVIGSDQAPRLLQRIDAGVDAAARELPPALRGTRVYFEVNSAPYAASESSSIGELLARVGAANVVPGKLGPFPKLNPEFVVRADPQVIMISDRNALALQSRPGWDRIQALRDGRVCRFSAQQADILIRPGPRMAEAAQLMVRCLSGKLAAVPPSPPGRGLRGPQEKAEGLFLGWRWG
jgi:iron complex transport system substrate-binding protein